MKKVLSVLLTVLVIALSFTFVAGAVECTCKDHTNSADGCHCCVYCPNLDTYYLTSCVKNADGSLKTNDNGEAEFCCTACNGIRPCHCGCDCCPENGEDSAEGPDQLLTDDQQQQVIDGFQSVLGRIREFFDKLFDAIFEFLRFDEIMGNN